MIKGVLKPKSKTASTNKRSKIIIFVMEIKNVRKASNTFFYSLILHQRHYLFLIEYKTK